MKRLVPVLALVVLAGCGRGQAPDNLAQAYIHKYGVQTDKSDWEGRGRNGQVITSKKDGVTVTENYVNGVLHGEATKSFPHSATVHLRETYEHGRLVTIQEHHRTGVPNRHTTLQPDGGRIVESWYDDGTPKSHEIYHGEFLATGLYYTPNNAVEARVENGQGVRIARDAAGTISSEDTVFAGQVVSSSTFYSDGEPKAITPYANGNIHGTRKTYLPGGLPLAVEEWKHGQLDGIVTHFENGRKVAEVPYVAGEKEGVEQHFDSTGDITREITWAGDEQHGPVRYLVAGRQTAIEWFHRGRLVRKTTWERLNGFAMVEY